MQLPESLTHKLGPLPVWAWGVVVGGAWLAVGFLHGGNASSAAAGPFATAQGNADNTGDTSGGDTGSYGGALNSPDTTSPVGSGSGLGASGGSFGGGGSSGGGGASASSSSSSANTQPTGGIDEPVIMQNPNAPTGPGTLQPTAQPTVATTTSATKATTTTATPTVSAGSKPNLVGPGTKVTQIQPDPKLSPTVTVATPAGAVKVPTTVANLLGAASVNQVALAAQQRPAENTGSLTAPSNTSTKVAEPSYTRAPTPAPPATTTKPKTNTSLSGVPKTTTKAQ